MAHGIAGVDYGPFRDGQDPELLIFPDRAGGRPHILSPPRTSLPALPRRRPMYRSAMATQGRGSVMATKVESREGRLYDEDFYDWALGQAALLRARHVDTLDLDNLVEEVEGVADIERSSVLNNARVVTEHLLKARPDPARDSRNTWRASIREHRARLEADLTPRLRREPQDEIERVFVIARRSAEGTLHDHGKPAADALPATCPYTLDQVTGDWWP